MERELIAHLRRRLPPHPLLHLGAGDDAAVLRLAGADECVLTVDMLMDGVDFRLPEADPRLVGRKALAVNLSDLAAMASQPLAGVVALALPRRGGMELAVELYEGLLPLAEQYGLAIAGGDTNSWDGPLAISVTLLGKLTARGPLVRSGARPGDRIVVTGSFGGSILGRHFTFAPRVREALRLMELYELHAGIDVSDGLSNDLAHLLQESCCGAVVDLTAIPVSDDARRLAEQRADGSTPLDHALADGEDFELILAVPAAEAERMIAERALTGGTEKTGTGSEQEAVCFNERLSSEVPVPVFSGVPLTVIGEFIEEPGLWQVDADGRPAPLAPRGYQHEFD